MVYEDALHRSIFILNEISQRKIRFISLNLFMNFWLHWNGLHEFSMCSWGCQSKSQYWCSWSTSLKGCYLPLFTLRGSQDFFRGGGTVGRLWITKLTKSICQWSDKQSPLWSCKVLTIFQHSSLSTGSCNEEKRDKKNKPIHETHARPVLIKNKY